MRNTIDAIVLIYSDSIKYGNHEKEDDLNYKEVWWHQNFLYGMEEEGVPIRCINAMDIEEINKYDALTMARNASSYSAFEIGVGVDAEKIIVRHRVQNDDEYLFVVGIRDDDKQIRIQGQNTARIIKKLPLFLDND